MDDLISRQAAIDSIQYAGKIGKQTCISILKRLPSAQPAVHGKWRCIDTDSYVCSVCGCELCYRGSIRTLYYCPACGARMEEK